MRSGSLAWVSEVLQCESGSGGKDGAVAGVESRALEEEGETRCSRLILASQSPRTSPSIQLPPCRVVYFLSLPALPKRRLRLNGSGSDSSANRVETLSWRKYDLECLALGREQDGTILARVRDSLTRSCLPDEDMPGVVCQFGVS